MFILLYVELNHVKSYDCQKWLIIINFMLLNVRQKITSKQRWQPTPLIIGQLGGEEAVRPPLSLPCAVNIG